MGLFVKKYKKKFNFFFNKKNKKNKLFYIKNASFFITNDFIDKIVYIYNGFSFRELLISKKMVGFRYGEFILTRKAFSFPIKKVKSKKK